LERTRVGRKNQGLARRRHRLSRFFFALTNYGKGIERKLQQSYPKYFPAHVKATKEIADSIKLTGQKKLELKKYTMKLYYLLSDGDKSAIDSFKATEIMEFFALLSVREEVMQERLDKMKKNG